MLATILAVAAAIIVLASLATIIQSRRAFTRAGNTDSAPDVDLSWYASYVPYLAGVIAALITWLINRDLDTWGIYTHPAIFAVTTTFVSDAFIRERASKQAQAVIWSVIVAACSAATIATW